jgi:hypothetical protein
VQQWQPLKDFEKERESAREKERKREGRGFHPKYKAWSGFSQALSRLLSFTVSTSLSVSGAEDSRTG